MRLLTFTHNGATRTGALQDDSIAHTIEYLSTAFTLVPGDVIATGTAAGVALFREGQPWLTEGQVVRVDIESLGHVEAKVAKDDGVSFIR